MGLKKKNKVSAEFSMSSLTDIIFLLLIFFMLTSSLVTPNALNLKLPGRNTPSVQTHKKIDDVSITASGKYFLNGKRISPTTLERELGRKARQRGRKKLTITISPDKNAPVEAVVRVMDIALRYHINAVLAAEKE